ncbi:STAS/SEC14 domain-containing protein [Flavobacterium sp. ST-87]|uniref:STAS/SEC14 domain-containing protein n=1 Tax=Flavobacterium plantiphilum TaxID=3163297 RepID=A0ABW8XQJ6_9FLAO
MITEIKDVPPQIVAFKAIGEVTHEDYTNIIVPAVQKLVSQTDEINFILYLDTNINFTDSACYQDALLGLKNLGNWNRAAIITDSSNIISFTKAFSYIIPGEFKGFSKENDEEAILWVSNKA